MILYEIFQKHNRPWSGNEILAYCILIAAAIAVSQYLFYRRRMAKSQAVSLVLLIAFLGYVLELTIFARHPDIIYKPKTEIFWSWRASFGGNQLALVYNLLNILLLFPMGALIPLVFNKPISWWKALLAGTIVSSVIEVSQLTLSRGYFEWDDIIHNGLGCMLGCLLMNWVLRKRLRNLP